MSKLPLAAAVSLSVLTIATAAGAHARCDGDFQFVHGNWVATRYCQRAVAEHVANRYHEHITNHAVRSSDMRPDEFCRWHNAEIETSTYCSSYND